MGKRGPSKTPSNLVLLKGNPGKRLNKKEAKPEPKIPDCPKWLNTDAKKMWERLSLLLNEHGLLTIVDAEAFAAACQSYGVWVQCEKKLKRCGRTIKIMRYDKSGNELGDYEQQRPEVSIGNAALKNFKSFCSEFGLTPAARAGIPIDSRNSEIEFESLLSL